VWGGRKSPCRLRES